MTEAAFPVATRAARRDGHPSPLSIWLIATTVVVALAGLGIAFVLFVSTPMPESDQSFFQRQLTRLDDQERLLASRGEHPLSIVFIGTSRLKNVVSSSDEVARAATKAGIRRPVASTHLAIYWGGFERFRPALESLANHRPDVVVVMPEFFFEDFNRLGRVRLGFRYLLTKFWGQEFTLFGQREYEQLMCDGFEGTVENRLVRHNEWMMDSGNSRGPMLARETVRKLADQGTLVIIADVPVTRKMSELRPTVAGSQFPAKSGLTESQNIRTAWMPGSFTDSDYCDWAHLDPERAGKWQDAFFSKVATDLNRIPS